jgi:hypothetical protein
MQQLPELKNYPGKTNTSAFDAIQTLRHIIDARIKKQDFTGVKRCFALAEALYLEGNAAVKNAVENVLIFSFTRMLSTYAEYRQQLLSIMPATVNDLYRAQLCHNGC